MVEIVAGVLIQAGRALLGHRHPQRTNYPDCWDVIGGHVEVGEGAIDALVRELAEELGIEVAAAEVGQPFRVVTMVDERTAETTLTLSVWVLDNWLGEVSNRAPDEHDALGWFGADELGDLTWADPAIENLVRAALTEQRD